MKKFTSYFPFLSLAFLLVFAACQSDTKIEEPVREESDKAVKVPVSTQSEEAKAAVYKGLDTWALGSEQDAHAYFTKALEHDPKLAVAHLWAGSTANSSKAFRAGLANAKANLNGASDFEKQMISMAETWRNNDRDARLAINKKMVADYPDIARCQYILGNTYRGNKEVALSRDVYQKAIAIDPNFTPAYMSLASSYLFSEPKDMAKAESTASKVVEMAPNSPKAQILIGDCYRAQNKLEQARDAYAKAIQLNPDDHVGYYKKGHANTYLGNLEEARADFQAGRQYDDEKNVTNEAYTYLYANKSKDAINYLEGQIAGIESLGISADRLTEVKLDMLQDCATIAFHMKNPTKVKAYKDQMVALSKQKADDAGTEAAMINHETDMLLWDALAAALNGKTDEANTILEQYKTIRAPINNPRKLDTWHFANGFVNMQKKDYKGAIAEFEQANQDWIYSQYWLAKAYELSGNKEKTHELYKKVADYNFNNVHNALIRNEAKKKIAAS